MIHFLNWRLGFSQEADEKPKEWMPAEVPGAVQLDYARYKGWGPFYHEVNFQDYEWMEDVFWHYEAPLELSLVSGQRAFLHFKGLDYRYRISVGEEVLAEGEGMFSPIYLEVTHFAGREASIKVLLYPVPKADNSRSRTQGNKSCKSVACYGWDWHPRLISTGIWDDVILSVEEAFSVSLLEASYTLSEAYTQADLTIGGETKGNGSIQLVLTAPDGNRVADTLIGTDKEQFQAKITVENPLLWYPADYGNQPRYTVSAYALSCDGTTNNQMSRKIGFRRVRLIMNEGAWKEPVEFPKSQSDDPITLEVNGIPLFAKGSNWVNAQVFPGLMTEANYNRLLTLARDAHMNILRVWGGGFINKESFYDLCDEKGILVWQEFPLSCNEYPDDKDYLTVLRQEAEAIVRRLRTHPCIAIWCGGNELFNSWSGMTNQHHALRLLNSICYEEDRHTPFLMTSPLTGMAHGHYLNYDEQTGEEAITLLRRKHYTAYTEFGCPGMAEPDYLRTFMSEKDFADCRPENEVWKEHHAFGAWSDSSWVRIPEVEYFFGEYTDTEDLCRKTALIQSMGYRSLFEEMRRQWPHCSLALNWCFNEPWPTAANNSLISWPDIPKPAYEAVKLALRPQIVSLSIDKHLWYGGEYFHAGIWLLNDCLQSWESRMVTAFYALNGDYQELGCFHCPEVAPQNKVECGAITFYLPDGYTGEIHIRLCVKDQSEKDSEYIYLCRATAKSSSVSVAQLNQ